MWWKREVEMFKSKAPDKDQSTAATLEEVVARAVQPEWSVVEHPPGREPMTKASNSCIGSDMSIVGNIECNGPAQVFGRIKGELRASDLVICDGAQIEGSVIAQDVMVCAMTLPSICAPSQITRSEARNSPLIRPNTCAGPLHSILPTIDMSE